MSESITELHLKLFKCLDQENYFGERKEIYDKVLSLTPKNAEEWAKKGFIYVRIKQPTEAISCFEEALKLEPNNVQFLRDISSVLFDNRHFKDSIPYLERIAEIASESASNWNLLAFCHLRIGHYDKAESLFKKALELDDQNATINFDLGMFYKNQGQYKKALEYLIKASKLGPNDDFVWFMLGHAYQKLEMSDEAIETYEIAVDLNPRNDSVWNNLGLEYVKQRDYKKAIECYKRAIQIDDKSGTVWHNLKFAYYGTEEFEKADYCEKKSGHLAEFGEFEVKKPKETTKWYFV
ncbi:Beta-barrel assembly-enhancing protease [subsurface metagenome]